MSENKYLEMALEVCRKMREGGFTSQDVQAEILILEALEQVAKEKDNKLIAYYEDGINKSSELRKSLEKQLSEKEEIINTLQRKLVQDIDPKVWKDGMIESQENKIVSLEQKLEKAKLSMTKCANPEEHLIVLKEIGESDERLA